jgi:transcription antitermination factor NusG
VFATENNCTCVVLFLYDSNPNHEVIEIKITKNKKVTKVLNIYIMNTMEHNMEHWDSVTYIHSCREVVWGNMPPCPLLSAALYIYIYIYIYI